MDEKTPHPRSRCSHRKGERKAKKEQTDGNASTRKKTNSVRLTVPMTLFNRQTLISSTTITQG